MLPTSSKNPNVARLPIMGPRDTMQNAAKLAARGVYAPPYPWEVPPPGHIARHIMGSKPAPNYGIANQVEMLNYTVPANSYFVAIGILFRYEPSTSLVPGSGDVVFTWDIDTPTTGTGGQGYAAGHSVPDYAQVLWNLGSFDFGPMMLANRPVFSAGQRLGMKAYTVRNVGQGAPNTVNAMLIGWEWPISQ